MRSWERPDGMAGEAAPAESKEGDGWQYALRQLVAREQSGWGSP